MPKAFTRAVSPRLSECELTHLDRVPIDAARADAQHSAYERVLADAGYEIIRLPDLPDHPDGVFVEDTALILDGHELGAVKVAHWLKDQPQVGRILHPAFAECAGHELWKRDFSGSSGLFTLALKGGGKADRDRVIDSFELFGIGYSWGGFESLAIHADTDNLRTASNRDYGGPLLRLHIGLEDPDDLIADLGQALASYPAG